MKKFSELIEDAVNCVKTYNRVIKTIDSHADDFLAAFKDPYERVFVKQVFHGCIRYEDFLKVFVNVFFKLHASSTNRNDAVLYQVFAYMTFFRLEELSISDYKKLIYSQEANKMNVFLLFAFNADKLREHMREPWMEFYDFQYIDEKVIGAVERNLPNVADILKGIEKKATGFSKNSMAMTNTNMKANQDGDTQSLGQSQSMGGVSMMEGTQTALAIDQDDGEEAYVKKPVTVQQPFNLTKLRPKQIPVPEAIKREVVANPVPKGMFKKTLADIEAEKKERRQATINAVRNEYEGHTKQRFNLATEGDKFSLKVPGMAAKEVSVQFSKIDKAKQEVENERHNEANARIDYLPQHFQHKVQHYEKNEMKKGVKQGIAPGPYAKPKVGQPLYVPTDHHEAKPMPDFEKHAAPVKLNAAHLKREKQLLDKIEADENRKIAEMALGLKDASEFNRWKREMDQKDDVERIEHIQKKKIEMELSRDQAILAQKNQEKENKKLVLRMKIESEKRLNERADNKQNLLHEKKAVVAQVHTQKDNASNEMAIMHQNNKEIRDTVKAEIDEGLKRRKDEEAHELRKREELIRQIREIEKIPIQRTKGFDPTEAGGHGLMVEMSVAELRERLEFVNRERQQEIDFKRDKNMAAKERESEQLMADAAKIADARTRRKEDADARRQQKKDDLARLEAINKAAREKGLLEAYGNINQKKKEKRDEEERLAKELKEIKLQRQYLNANAAMVEMKAWQELEAGKEREIRDGQNEKLIEQSKLNGISVKDQTVRASNARSSVMEKLNYDKGYKERLTTRKRENEVLHKNTLEYKSQMHTKQQNFEADLKVQQRKRQPFNAKINEQSLNNATKFRHAREQAEAGETLVDLDQQAMHIAEEEEGYLDQDEGEGQSALDMLDGADHANDSIEAKLNAE